LLRPLFEYSGACAGCGETPYVKLLSQLFGDRAIIANATGCSSIYGGNLPTTPYTQDADGRGPTWSNSLFEDNAEFAFGFRLTAGQAGRVRPELLQTRAASSATSWPTALLNADQSDEAGIAEQRERVAELKSKRLAAAMARQATQLLSRGRCAGQEARLDPGRRRLGLRHRLRRPGPRLASGATSTSWCWTPRSTPTPAARCPRPPRGAVAKFAAGGKRMPKKDLGMMAMTYGNIYVAQVAMGANDAQTVKAFVEAESYDGPSLIIAYSHCIAHGINMTTALTSRSWRWTAATGSCSIATTRGREPEEYLEHIRQAKNAVDIPIIASLNGITPGGWVRYARHFQEAGADAVELNVYWIPTNFHLMSYDVEDLYVKILRRSRSRSRSRWP
jgi:pyruvate-ferredoxin/flavodoxin oxidoreductase